MFFSFLKPQKPAEPKLEKYNSFDYLKYFPRGLTIQTSEKKRYLLDSRGFLNFQSWEILEDASEKERDFVSKTEKFGFVDSTLESLVDGKILAIGTLPLEKAEEMDEIIAESIRADNGRMNHYHAKAKNIMKQFGQNPATNPYISSQCFPLIILYTEFAAIRNERLGIYFSEGKWKIVNSEP